VAIQATNGMIEAHYLLCILPSVALGFAVTETVNFYVRGRLLTTSGYWAIWKRNVKGRVASAFGPTEWLVCGALFSITPYVAMVYVGGHATSYPQEIGVAFFVFAATLFVYRFVAFKEKDEFTYELIVAAATGIFAVAFSIALGGFIGILSFFVWYTAQAALLRYLRTQYQRPQTDDAHESLDNGAGTHEGDGHRIHGRFPEGLLHREDIGLYHKDMNLITIIFVLAAGGYRYIMLAPRVLSMEILVGAIAVSLIAIAIVIWEHDRNHGAVGESQSRKKIRRYLRKAPDEAKIEQVRDAILDHIRVRDVAALFGFVVVPFVAALLVLAFLPQITGVPIASP
jgi:hypothetical protein